MSDRLRDLLGDGGIHVMDGAMGTVLYQRGVFVNVCYDELCLTQPDVVLGVHADYVRAGAELIETNTFGANPIKLSAFGLDGRTEEINESAADLARKAGGDRAAVLGAIGPLGIRIEPWGPTSIDEAADLFARQAAGLAEGGVDGFILETFSDVEEIAQAVRAVRRVAGYAPVFAQMTFGEDGFTAYGTTIETIVEQLEALEVDVVGLNCSVGPSAMLAGVERMVAVADRPVSALPNAGLPRDVGDRKIYLASPEYMARYGRRMAEAGARFIGGCCGTTPEHTHHLAGLLGAAGPRRRISKVVDVAKEKEGGPLAEPVALGARSGLGRRLAHGEFVNGVELTPPRGWEPRELFAGARHLRDVGIDTIHIVDGPTDRSRIASIPAAILLERELGVETVPHYSCRDRNMLGMVGDLLGAAAAGIRNVLLVTGDPPRQGPYDTGGVYDIDSIGLTNVARQLNLGLDPGGGSIGAPTSFVVGVAVNPGAIDLEEEIRRFAWKAEAGADYAVTQPVYDVESFLSFLRQVEEFGVPIIAGLWPPLSLRNVEFLANEVPGITVPAEVIERMRAAQDGGETAAHREGIALTREVLDEIREAIAGVMVSAPGGRVDRAIAVLD
ncbi:MAG: bifunctional homocysteine S-methyltransferase/methylenetetrahydrofolate reductase [Gemmatimonadota bacterium]